MAEDSAPSDPAQSENDPTQAPKDDPLDIKKSATGVGVLIVVLAILLLLSTFGPTGAKWIENRISAMFGIDTEKLEEKPKPEEAIPSPPPENIETPPPSPAPQPKANSKYAYYRSEMLEQMGGPAKATINHVAVSQDESVMAAEVTFNETGKTMEIFFEKDDLGRYVSTEDTPLETPIKIYPDETVDVE